MPASNAKPPQHSGPPEDGPPYEYRLEEQIGMKLASNASESHKFPNSNTPSTSPKHSTVPDSSSWSVPDGKLQVRVIKVSVNKPARRMYVRLTLGDQIFRTSISEDAEGYWNESFDFDVTYHSQLFGICQLDLFEANVLFSDTHIGRAEIPLSQLEGMPEHFHSCYELWDKRVSPSNITSLDAWDMGLVNHGAIQVRINYRYQGLVSKVRQTNMKAESQELDRKVGSIFRSRLESALEEKGPTTGFRKIEEQESRDALAEKEEYLFSLGESEEIKSTESSSAITGFSRYLFSDQTLQVLQGISKLSAAFGQGLVASNVEILAGLVILEKFYLTVADVKTRKYIQDLNDIEYPAHFYKYAMAAYGWRGLHFFGKQKSLMAGAIGKESDATSIREFLVLPREDLLGFEFRNGQVFQPSYFIALDRSTNSIVLSIRGTMSAQDTLTDLVCEYQPWNGGVIHAGMKSSAQFFMTEIIPQLLAHIAEHKVDTLNIVGHSLGGSTASILTMMIIEHQDEIRQASGCDFKIQCYAYGPGPSVSLDLAKKYEGVIHSYVNESDIVCRLSYGSMMDFKSMILCAVECSSNHLQELLGFGGVSGLSGNSNSSEKWKKRFNFLMEHRQKIIGKKLAKPKLYIAGTVFHLYSEPTLAEPNRTLMEQADAEDFSEMLIRSSIIMDHLPSKYESAFHKARETLMRGKVEIPTSPNEEPSSCIRTELAEQFAREIENPSLTQLPLDIGVLGLSQQVDST
ncbi:alpha/beta-hydrolase [Basidiobolus meristosporus CBS 931.73]|uniref:sn-1-specific diacylglycerol lipase n=1 Tax=Basidiobolus meristosporus CBS 931.73 TaxID=1314790 RepID=A0A1Y1XXC7_9FUNG|nr:alpha/beta-hydrolase [Basidiobolus meristosporus CBS 931.73]|eukprot:ORX90393.1 alpha/beta-hydrolase [Basidiobolus meristosporus CBS 931.73]